MSFASYWKGAVWELLLSCVAAAALLYTMLHGFYIDPALQYSAIPAVAVVVSLVALYTIAFNKTTLRIGAVVYTLVMLAVLGFCVASTSSILVDEESNYLVFALCAILTPLVVFALGRTRGSAAVLFILGTFIIVFIQFFYEMYEVAWSLAFVLSSLALVIYKNYRRSVETVRSVKKVSFAPGFLAAFGSVLVSLAAGCAIWFGIIAPLNPPAMDIKLITEEHALETQRVRGIASMFLIPNLDMTSSHTNDEERTTDDLQLVEDGRIVLANGEEAGDPEEQAGSTFTGINLDSLKESFDFQRYDQDDWLRLIVASVLLVLLAVAYFVGRRWWRAHRLAKIRGLAPEQQVERIYLFLMNRFERVGFKIPPGQSVLEYAADSAHARERFDNQAGVAFTSLTETYTRVKFGGGESVTQEQADDFSNYYKAFWKSCRAHLGSLKYFFKSFRL